MTTPLTLSSPTDAIVIPWSKRSWESVREHNPLRAEGFPGSHGPANQAAMMPWKDKEKVKVPVGDVGDLANAGRALPQGRELVACPHHLNPSALTKIDDLRSAFEEVPGEPIVEDTPLERFSFIPRRSAAPLDRPQGTIALGVRFFGCAREGVRAGDGSTQAKWALTIQQAGSPISVFGRRNGKGLPQTSGRLEP